MTTDKPGTGLKATKPLAPRGGVAFGQRMVRSVQREGHPRWRLGGGYANARLRGCAVGVARRLESPCVP